MATKEVSRLIKRLESAGCTVTLGGKHYKVYDGTGDFVISLPTTPSDYRWERNALSQIKRRGVRLDAEPVKEEAMAKDPRHDRVRGELTTLLRELGYPEKKGVQADVARYLKNLRSPSGRSFASTQAAEQAISQFVRHDEPKQSWVIDLFETAISDLTKLDQSAKDRQLDVLRNVNKRKAPVELSPQMEWARSVIATRLLEICAERGYMITERQPFGQAGGVLAEAIVELADRQGYEIKRGRANSTGELKSLVSARLLRFARGERAIPRFTKELVWIAEQIEKDAWGSEERRAPEAVDINDMTDSDWEALGEALDQKYGDPVDTSASTAVATVNGNGNGGSRFPLHLEVLAAILLNRPGMTEADARGALEISNRVLDLENTLR